MLKARRGGGTFIEHFSFAPILDQMPLALERHSEDLRNLLEVRAGLEEGLIGRASEWVRRRDLEELRRLATSMATADPSELAELDRRFHLRLYEPLENPLVNQLIDLFWEVFYRLAGGDSASAPPGPAVARLHLEIVEALASEGNATEAMVRHFDDVRDRLNSSRG